ncbi:SGNH hydrolase-type esterase domain-containing protein [Obelidium mucronatum]|nr:SGNH hydrolase-type esterase domain-containing protein [Obelidium mucronatum]
MLQYLTSFLANINVWYLALLTWLNQTFFCSTPFCSSRYGKFVHQLVVIGDDFAYGSGDVQRLGSPPGLAKHLCNKIMKERKVKHVWEFFNCGIVGSTSRDWLPRSQLTKDAVSKGYFDKVFSNKRTEKAEIVIIMVGFNDARTNESISPEETIQNITSICRVLRNLGKDVYLCTICTYGDAKHLSASHIEGNLRRNEGILSFLKDNKEGVIPGPRLDAESYEFKSNEFFHSDGIHMSHKAYVKLSKDVSDMLITNLIKREFDVMKSLLGY